MNGIYEKQLALLSFIELVNGMLSDIRYGVTLVWRGFISLHRRERRPRFDCITRLLPMNGSNFGI